ncbi:MAG: spondin domain-containing protein [Patescibacteria group bacterium]
MKVVITALFILLFSVSISRAEILEVRVKNIMTGQIMTPPLIAVGVCTSSVFSLGSMASVGVEKLAEGGLTTDLAQWFRGKGWTTITGSAVYPGKWYITTLQVPVIIPPSNLCLFVGGMLVPTNDGFYAVQNLRVRSSLALTIFIPAYDAGTEFNDELCAHMPAPDACGSTGEGYNPLKNPLEGLITFHRGIHGYEDSQLDPRVNDFDTRTVGILYLLLR